MLSNAIAAVLGLWASIDENQFWTLVDAARETACPSVDGRVMALCAQLLRLSAAELQQFQDVYDAQLKRAYRWDICAAAKIIEGHVTDDSFLYFRDWLISEGWSVFETAMRDPDTLASEAPFQETSLERFGYAALAVFQQKGAGELKRSRVIKDSMPEGQDWQEDDLPALLPKLWAKYSPLSQN